MSEAAAHFRNVAQRLKTSGDLDAKVLNVDTNTLLYQVPGGMLSNLISQLKQQNAEDKYYEVLAEVPRVREDFGYPPLVTPTSQIVGTQAVLNVLMGRYKMISKESKGLLRGEYGLLPGKVNEEVRKKVIGDRKVITCRPVEDPSYGVKSLEEFRKEIGQYIMQDEDVLSYALFPQVAEKYFKYRQAKENGVDSTILDGTVHPV
jgi:oxaloacetate decarboxylase alpha subunit